MSDTFISTERFFLRELTEDDATERYLSWFGDYNTKKFILSAANTTSLLFLRQYILDRINRKDILFLGIFEKKSGLHIGNIKYEPVNSNLGYTIMGILIGDYSFRGKGVSSEVLKATATWLNAHRQIEQILLGVSKDNIGAIRSYEKTGFKVAKTPYINQTDPNIITMVWCL